jgi:hypothetical protein
LTRLGLQSPGHRGPLHKTNKNQWLMGIPAAAATPPAGSKVRRGGKKCRVVRLEGLRRRRCGAIPGSL